MAENKTQPTDQPVADFLASVTPERRRLEGERLLAIMTEVTGDEAVMWGPTMVGFGSYHYRYASGREGDMLRVGFSPRKAQLSLYGLNEDPAQKALLERLGPHTSGASCVYVKRLEDVDEEVLRDLIDLGYQHGDYDATA
ncbi:DUF1801 domain-containing protein [uncultured Demequina sp.]|uniref:DUF1801 domain-containing protein n=1 Tax=uncultured Demequina sp. TaxID=693499 RepID=UPI0025E4EA61|nr:DUF1801 domain-containing protein [uncultured Demequina sp.]